MNDSFSTPGVICVGICSLCGGQVQVPEMWAGSIPPVPTCIVCAAVKKPDTTTLNVIQMQPRNLA